jgi:hypothetical protein
LNYPNISVYDRSRPLDYKHDLLQFEIKTDIVKPVLDKRNLNVSVLEEQKEKIDGLDVVDKMFTNYITALLTSKKNKVTKGENNWYEYCGLIIKKMITDEKIVPGINDEAREENLKIFLIQHIADELMMTDRVILMNYFEDNNDINSPIPATILTNTMSLFQKFQKITKEKAIEENKERIRILFSVFIKEVKEYLYLKIIVSSKSKLRGIVIFNGPSSLFNDGSNNGNLNLFIQRGQEWVPAEAEDKRELFPLIKRKYKLTKDDHLNKYVGFIGFESNKQYMAFKIKDTTEERNTAFRCDQSGKNNIIDRLNEIESERLEEKRYVKKNLKKAKEENTEKTKDGAFELCIREEFTLRSFQKIENSKVITSAAKPKSAFKIVWFLDTETALFNEFEKREKASK